MTTTVEIKRGRVVFSVEVTIEPGHKATGNIRSVKTKHGDVVTEPVESDEVSAVVDEAIEKVKAAQQKQHETR